jgi:magnesium protoporphyrin O-methyltransferase
MIGPLPLLFLALFGSVSSLTTVSKRLFISKNAFQGYLTVLRSSAVDDKVEVEEYFNNEGFNRWNKIYSNSDEVNKVQLDIRKGHQQTIDKVLGWLEAEKLSDKTICDAGCGVGSLSIPLAKKFRKVFASDISAAMTKEAADRAKQEKIKNIEFKVRITILNSE